MIYACPVEIYLLLLSLFLSYSTRSRIPMQVRVHSSRTSSCRQDTIVSTIDAVIGRKEEVVGTSPFLVVRGGMLSARERGVTVRRVYNSADYRADRERPSHCRDDREREKSRSVHNEFIDYTTRLSCGFTVNARVHGGTPIEKSSTPRQCLHDRDEK